MGRTRLEVAVYDAAIVYNEGEMGRLPIFQILGLDRKRVLSAEKQVTEAAKTGRKRRQVAQAGTSTGDGSCAAGAF